MSGVGAGSENGAVGGATTSRTAGPGAVVTDTGIALVHEGEFIYAAAGSEAEVAVAEMDARLSVNIHLPVIIEVVGQWNDADLERTVDETLRRLRRAVEAHREVG